MRRGGGFIGTPSFAPRFPLPLSVLPPTLSAHDHSIACECNFRLHPSPCWRLFAHPVVSPPTSLTRLYNIQLLPSSSSLPLTSLTHSPYLHAFAFSFLQSLTIFSVLLSPATPLAPSSSSSPSRPLVIIPFPSLPSHLGEISCLRPPYILCHRFMTTDWLPIFGTDVLFCKNLLSQATACTTVENRLGTNLIVNVDVIPFPFVSCPLCGPQFHFCPPHPKLTCQT
ncbi:hypothetical protein H4582DRAFT_1951034 [Lactarius indigo]|nr:hypothetical protein H4582DRAFT_1951034 [Lactarius indigo]